MTDLTEKIARKHLNLLVSTGVFMKNKLGKEKIYIIKNLDYFLSKNNLE